MTLASYFVRATSTGDASRSELDALRGIAVLAVVFQHYADPHRGDLVAAIDKLPVSVAPFVQAVVSHAHVGVDLFFVLSGFTLALAWSRARERNAPPTTARFFVRRAARLVPAYVVALALVIALEPWQLRGESPTTIGLALSTHLAFLQGYVTFGSIVLIGASWSLSTEVSFYLLFPWLARMMLDGTRRSVWPTAIGLAAASWATKALLHDVAVTRATWPGLLDFSQWRFVGTRLDEFVLGMLVATIARERGDLAPRQTIGLLVGAAALFVVGARLEDLTYGRPGGGLPYVLVSSSVTLFVFAVASASPRMRRAFSPAPLVFVGVVSYGIFLLHQLVERFVRVALPCQPGESGLRHAFVVAGSSLALSILAGALSFALIERPVLERSARSRARRGAKEVVSAAASPARDSPVPSRIRD